MNEVTSWKNIGKQIKSLRFQLAKEKACQSKWMRGEYPQSETDVSLAELIIIIELSICFREKTIKNLIREQVSLAIDERFKDREL
jgi:hypothetical protein